MKKTILITGSTDGIGKLAAERLAKEGHKMYIHGRNSEKLEQVVAQIKASSANDTVSGLLADLSDLDAVHTLCGQLKKKGDPLDILVNNAGVFKAPISNTRYGIDIRMVVNYLAPYLLTHELNPLLKKSKDGRVINLSSAAQSPVSLEFLKGNTQVGVQEAYAQSKLAILMWSFYLAKVEPDISVIALNPGSLLNTNMVREAYGRFWSSAEKGGDIMYDLVTHTQLVKYTGQYYDNDRGSWGEAHPDAYDLELINEMINETKRIVNELTQSPPY